jgi:hypothetical protein
VTLFDADALVLPIAERSGREGILQTSNFEVSAGEPQQ